MTSDSATFCALGLVLEHGEVSNYSAKSIADAICVRDLRILGLDKNMLRLGHGASQLIDRMRVHYATSSWWPHADFRDMPRNAASQFDDFDRHKSACFEAATSHAPTAASSLRAAEIKQRLACLPAPIVVYASWIMISLANHSGIDEASFETACDASIRAIACTCPRAPLVAIVRSTMAVAFDRDLIGLDDDATAAMEPHDEAIRLANSLVYCADADVDVDVDAVPYEGDSANYDEVGMGTPPCSLYVWFMITNIATMISQMPMSRYRFIQEPF